MNEAGAESESSFSQRSVKTNDLLNVSLNRGCGQ